MTGMDTRIGYPNEHLASEVPEETISPMYSTGIGLVIEGTARYLKEKEKEISVKTGTKKTKIKTKRVKKEQKPISFLKRMQDWFEKDGID
jgi:cell division protein FtsA